MTSGGREVLKWLALVLMTGDHVNTILFSGSVVWLGHAGRVVFPIFACVLAWNLHESGPASSRRAINRLLVAGLLVQPLHAIAFGYWLPGNILLTLALGLVVSHSPVWWIAVPAWALGGLLVDYQWAGVGVIVGASVLAGMRGHWKGWAVFAATLIPLCWFNGNAWALLSLPLLWSISLIGVKVPRYRWVFLGYYAAHLFVLAALAGYVFPGHWISRFPR